MSHKISPNLLADFFNRNSHDIDFMKKKNNNTPKASFTLNTQLPNKQHPNELKLETNLINVFTKTLLDGSTLKLPCDNGNTFTHLIKNCIRKKKTENLQIFNLNHNYILIIFG